MMHEALMTRCISLIEYMPAHLRASHLAARNAGTYPANGAERAYVLGDVLASQLDPDWAGLVEDGLRLVDVPEGEPVHDDVPAEAQRLVHGDDREWDDPTMGGVDRWR